MSYSFQKNNSNAAVTVGELNQVVNGVERPYRVYTALLTQSGTDAPVATVLENTIGNVIWSYDSEGIYKAESIGNFTESKTVVFISSGSNYSNFPSFYPTVYSGNNDYFYITTAAIENPPNYNTNGSLLMTPIEIRVYN